MDGQQQRDDRASPNWQNSRVSVNGARSAAGPHRRNDESWVEISSQPSSSSLSSIGDEIVTTGLRVGGAARRRRPHHHQPIPRSFHVDQTAIHAGTSSQEEYEESESEEDRCLTSSNENLQPAVRASFQQQSAQAESDDSDDGDEIATALGRVTDEPVFRPQPNAFSHPPAGLNRSHSANSAIHQHPHSSVRPSLSNRAQTRVSRGPPSFMSPAYQADNDAALRASLTTLLSCAAAARGLPKYKDAEQHGAPAHAGVGPSSQPVELRLMPESELMADRPPQSQSASPSKTLARSRTATSSVPSSPKSDGVEKHKRTSSSQTRSSRATKKKKVSAGDDALISPTLLTWVVSAGVVVLVSVVGFGAGYVIGREVGRQEALSAAGAGVNASTVADSSSCGREVIRSSGGGLRRLRWGAGVGRSVVA
ncbi:hypothetical protein C8035_v000311 [Colletotrichum spinosum]|uniref:Uncharacterized protein n=1 Tax=Colletotrichum spinosum TaxID=1347390 RepID=A0A4V3HQ18_9PEZI|nr:hypothetical protein C8035_v000311 [Colletotrichum spinosum]